MPRSGYKTITVKTYVYTALKKFAHQSHRSVPQVVEYLIEKCRTLLELEVPAE